MTFEQQLHRELSDALLRLAIHAGATLSFDSEQVAVSEFAQAPAVAGHPMPENPLVRAIQSVLYSRCYARRPALRSAPAPPDPDFVARLRASNRSTARWDPGWTVYSNGSNGQVFVHKGDAVRSAAPGEFVTPAGWAAGATLLVQTEALGAQPGFYFVFGETLADQLDETNLVRFYFHATAEGAPTLLEKISAALNRYFVPFRWKTLTEPGAYDRADAMVLYVPQRFFPITARLLRGVHEDARSALRPTPPLFSKELLPGIGVAEEPGTGESFGMHRCRLCAEGIVDALSAGDSTVDGRIRAIAHRFLWNGLDLRKPYLNAGSTDFLELPAEAQLVS